MPRPDISAAFADTWKVPSGRTRSARQVAWGDILITVLDDSNGRIDPQSEGGGAAAVFPSQEATPCGGDIAGSENDGGRERRRQRAAPAEKTTRCTRVIMKDRRRKDFNYNRVKNVMRRRLQIDELDRRLREEEETSRRLKSAVAVLTAKLNAAEAGRRRSNGVERAFFSHLVETEALILQREMLIKPGAQQTRAERMEAARNEAHKSLVLVLRGELEANSPWRISAAPITRHPTSSATSSTPADASIATTGRKDADTAGRPSEAFGATDSKTCGSDDVCGFDARRGGGNGGSEQQRRWQHQEIQYIPIDGTHKTISCWDSETPVQAYRRVAGKVMQRLSSALFGQELLALETARTSTAEREKMLEERANASFESQFSLLLKEDQLENLKSTLRSKIHEAQTALQEAREANKLQRDVINDAYGVESNLRRCLLSVQVAKDHLSETVVQHLQNIQTAVHKRTGFVPRSVQRVINDLVAVCSASGTSELTIERSPAWSSSSP